MKIQFPNGNEYSDDGSTAQDMNEGGHRTHLFPMVQDTIEIAADTLNQALAANQSAKTASTHATNASQSATAAANSATNAKSSADRAEAAAKNAESSDKLPLAGGTMTGTIGINHNESSSQFQNNTPFIKAFTNNYNSVDQDMVATGAANNRISLFSLRPSSPISTTMGLNSSQSVGIMGSNALVTDGQLRNIVASYASFMGFSRNGNTVFATGTNNTAGAVIDEVDLNFSIGRTLNRSYRQLQLEVEGTANNHVVTKKYVDDKVANAGVDLSTYALKTDLSAYVPLSGATLTNYLTLHANPTANNHAATKSYVDTAVGTCAKTDDLAKYVPVTGATITGTIGIDHTEKVTQFQNNTPFIKAFTNNANSVDQDMFATGGANNRFSLFSLRPESPISTAMGLNSSQAVGVIGSNAIVKDGQLSNAVASYASFIGFNRNGNTVFATGTNNTSGAVIDNAEINFSISRTRNRSYKQLQLDEEGTANNHVVTKKYVDDKVANAGVDLSSYALKTDLSAYLPKSGGTLTNYLTLHAQPTANNHAATKSYVDTAVNITTLRSENSTATGTNSVCISTSSSQATGTRAASIASSSSKASNTDSATLGSQNSEAEGARAVMLGSFMCSTKQTGAGLFMSSRTINPTPNTLGYGYANNGDSSAANLKFLVLPAGGVQAAGQFQPGATFGDYAEFFENCEEEIIPLGTLVSLDGSRVKPANGEDKVLGVITGTFDEKAGCFTGTSSIVCGDTQFTWGKRYLTGEFGEILYQTIPDPDWCPTKIEIDEEGKEVEVSNGEQPLITVPIENPEFDITQSNIPRSHRPKEWSCVGLIGQVHVRIDKTVQVGEYLVPTEGGMGSLADKETNLLCMKIKTPFTKKRGYGVALCLLK